MKSALFFPILFLGFIGLSQTQKDTLPLNFDGIVEKEEWETAQKFNIPFEIDPGDNSPAPYKTEAFVRYTSTDLYAMIVKCQAWGVVFL